MGRRSFRLRNYRNIGVSKEEGKFEELRLNSSLERENIGELVIVIGENNAGKSNVLDGIAAIGPQKGGEAAPLSESDAPDFIDFEDARPEIALAYDGVDGKSCEAGYALDDGGKARFKASPGIKETDIAPARGERRLSGESEAALKKEVEGKLSEYEELMEGYDENEGGEYLVRLSELSSRYRAIAASPEGIDAKKLKDVYSRLQELLDDFASSYNNSYMDELTLTDFADLDSLISYAEDEAADAKARKDVIKEKYGISLVPQIVVYKEEEIKDSDLVAVPESVKDSKFFNALLKAAGTSADAIAQAYEKAEKGPSHKKRYQNSINEKLKENAVKKFNDLFFQGLPSQEYSFEITLEKEEIYLSMEKNGSTFSLSQQSAGFRWFFNFFFNFLYAAGLQAGDIVLMDEPGYRLAIPARRRLRSFLKDFAKSSGVTFVAATQNSELIDPDFLDELRVIRQKGGEAGAEIRNDFSAIGEDDADTINEVLAAFGARHGAIAANPGNTVVYVEGIACYNCLTAFKLLKEEEEGKKISLAFLPIAAIGEDEAQMKRKIALLARHKGAAILAGGASQAEMLKKAANEQEDCALAVLQLKDIEEGFEEIGDLFAPADKERHEEMLEGKSGAASSLFKRNIFDLAKKGEIDARTKANFYKALDCLAGVK